MKTSYRIYKNTVLDKKLLYWNDPAWENAEIAEIEYFRKESSDHHPATKVKIQYDEHNIYILFKVDDKYIRSIYKKYNSKVNEDSCVEWFIQPAGVMGYYNFELNAGGTLHVNYIIDPERDMNGKRKNIQSIPEDHAKQIKVQSTLPRVIDPEKVEPLTWKLGMIIPFTFFDLYTPIEKIDSSIWRGNLYKCGDKTSHPHWGSWRPVSALNFHLPECFGEFEFSKYQG